MGNEDGKRFDEPVVIKRTPIFCFRKFQDVVPARVVLYILSFSGFLSSFMMRTDINIAIVAMVKGKTPPRNATDPRAEDQYCYALTSGNITFSNMSGAEGTSVEDGEFEWDKTIQWTILSCFYWMYVISQVVGGVLTQRFGTKAVFGFSQLATALCSLLIPIGAEIHYSAIIVLRCIQGFASGITWPAMYAAVGPWIPPTERSRFMSSFQGFSFGIGVTYLICGFLIAHFGWRCVFYVTGGIGVTWCLFWYLLAYDTPVQHPRISKQELKYIQKNVGNTAVGGRGRPVPWKAIFTSAPAWSIGITTFGRIWVHYVFITAGPTYMKTVLGFSIQKNGLLNGAPFLCSYIASVGFCYIADVLVEKQLLSLTNVRKLMTFLSQVIPGLLVLAIGYLGCNIVLVLIAWFFAVTLITASYAGAMASIVDIAPNYAGPILAFAQTIHMTASFLSPLAVGTLTQDSESLDQWRKVFWVSAIIAVGTYVVFQIFGTADVQKWNYPEGIPQLEEDASTDPLNGHLKTDKNNKTETQDTGTEMA